MSNDIFLSIRPEYANKIFKHTKTVELRRIRPKRLEKGNLVLIYVPSPVQAFVGTLKVDEIVEKPVKELWRIARGKAGMTRQEFNSYFTGVSVGVGIFFKSQEVLQLLEPIKLKKLREQNFYPPQSFRYATNNEIVWLKDRIVLDK
jgi:predicted transcriptional regulator